MGQSEYELIRYEQIRHLQIFVTSISFRNAHIHRAWELGLVLEGDAAIRTKDDTFTVHAGDLLMFNPNQSHEIASLNPTPVKVLILQTSVHFCGDYLPALRRVEFDQLLLRACLTGDQYLALQQDCLALARTFWGAESYRELLCIGHLCLLFQRLLTQIPHRTISDQEYSSRKKKADRLSRITSYIEEHYFEPIRLSDLAESEGVTTAYLSHFLRDNLNITFQDYLNITRFEKALQLISDPGLSLLDICMECGFSDSRYLNKLFLQRFGCSAKDYRSRMHRGLPRSTSAQVMQTVTSERILSPEEGLACVDAFFPR